MHKKNSWLKSMPLFFLLTTIFLDAAFTLTFIKTVATEGHMVIRHFMEKFGIYNGLILGMAVEVSFWILVFISAEAIKYTSITLITLGAAICHVQSSLTWLQRIGIIGVSEVLSVPFYISLIYAFLLEFRNLKADNKDKLEKQQKKLS